MKILVVVYGPLGDSLFTIPSLKSLRLGYPRAEITLVTSTAAAEFFTANPYIDKVVKVAGERGLIKKLIQLREFKYDLGLALSNIASYFLPLVKAKIKAGFRRELRFIYDLATPDCRTIHAVDYCLAVTETVGGKKIEAKREYKLPINKKDQVEVIKKVTEKSRGQLELQDKSPSQKDALLPSLLVIHPGGKFFKLKRWPPEKYEQLLKLLDEQLNLNIILIGGPEEREYANNVWDSNFAYNNIILNLVGELSLKETTALLSLADLFLGNDSAPQHIAAAVNTPGVILFGPTSPANYHPYGTDYRIIRTELNCSPCFTWLGNLLQYIPEYLPDWSGRCNGKCMKKIKVEDVVSEIINMLSLKALSY